MVLKKDNVERIILDESVANTMLSKGWKDVTPKEATKSKKDRKKEDAE